MFKTNIYSFSIRYKQTIYVAILALYFASIVLGANTQRNQAMLLLAVLACFCLVGMKKHHAISKPVLYLCLLFPLLTVVPSFLAQDPFSQIKLFLLPVLFLFIPALHRRINLPLYDFCIVLVIVATFCLLWNAYTLYILNLGRGGINSLVDFIIIYDMMCATFCLLAFVYAFELARIRRPKAALGVLLVSLSAIFILILHGTRGVLVGMPIVFLYVFWYYRKTGKTLMVWTALLSAWFCYYAYVSDASPLKNRMVLINQQISAFQASDKGNTSVGDRLVMWQLAVEDFNRSPLYGVGIQGATATRCQANQAGRLGGCYTHAHNIFLQEMSSHGLMGLAAILLILIYPLYLFARGSTSPKANTRLASVMGVVTVTYTGLNGLTDNYLGFSRSLTFYYFLIVVLLLYLRPCKETAPSTDVCLDA